MKTQFLILNFSYLLHDTKCHYKYEFQKQIVCKTNVLIVGSIEVCAEQTLSMAIESSCPMLLFDNLLQIKTISLAPKLFT